MLASKGKPRLHQQSRRLHRRALPLLLLMHRPAVHPLSMFLNQGEYSLHEPPCESLGLYYRLSGNNHLDNIRIMLPPLATRPVAGFRCTRNCWLLFHQNPTPAPLLPGGFIPLQSVASFRWNMHLRSYGRHGSYTEGTVGLTYEARVALCWTGEVGAQGPR